MKDLISREALASKAIYMHGFGENKYIPLKAVQSAPAVDAVEVVHAKWVDSKHRLGFYMCSHCECNDEECQPFYKNVWKVCPHCGARMNLEE